MRNNLFFLGQTIVALDAELNTFFIQNPYNLTKVIKFYECN